MGTSEGPQVGGAALSPGLTKARAPPVSNSAVLMQPKKRNHSPSLGVLDKPCASLGLPEQSGQNNP